MKRINIIGKSIGTLRMQLDYNIYLIDIQTNEKETLYNGSQ